MGSIFRECPAWNPEDPENVYDWARQQIDLYADNTIREWFMEKIGEASRAAYESGYNAGHGDSTQGHADKEE